MKKAQIPGQSEFLPDKLHEECAVMGVSLFDESAAGGEAAALVCSGLIAMQHRGQESAGIAVSSGSAIYCHKAQGLVGEVFTPDVMAEYPRSAAGVGHTRYSTTGGNVPENAQPFVTEFLTGRIATAHNGNIMNARELREGLEPRGLDFSATSDTEVISSLIAYRILKTGDLLGGIVEAAKELRGAYSLVILTGDHKLIAVRDPVGYRPLGIGKSSCGMAVASESCALDSCGFEFVRDVAPGEIVIMESGGITHSGIYLKAPKQGVCIFEYVYFARPDSVIDGMSVYEARFHMGRMLAREHPVEADAVCGVPDSGLEAAMGYAAESGLPLVSGFVKNRYIGRSFIFPTQAQRELAVHLKLNPLRATVAGKRIVLVDDSIVRGTTSARIIDSLHAAGVKEIHMRSSSPPFRHTCHFGTDIDSEENLIANQLTIEQIRRSIGADSLGFISPEGLREACGGCGLPFCTGCFTGDYRMEIEDVGKNELEAKKK